MTTTRLTIGLAALIGLSGCAVMNTQECIDANWYDIGIEQGRNGRTASADFLRPYYKACSKADVTPDAEAYEAGRAEGARYFCRAENGFDVGRQGRQYNGVCDADLEAAFLAEFDKGKELYSYEQPIREIEQDISELEDELERKQSTIRGLRSELQNNDDLTREQRQEKRDQILRYSDEVDDIEDRLDRLYQDLDRREERLDKFKTRTGYF